MHWSVGVDNVEPGRLAQRLSAHPALADELFTAAEQVYCRSQFHSEQSFAGRFAAKEAVVKALQLDGWDPLEIEIIEGDPAPKLILHGTAAEAANSSNLEIRLSLTHVASLATAVAIAIPRTIGTRAAIVAVLDRVAVRRGRQCLRSLLTRTH
jgi:holo-[acyl-carrier protein] synthase